VSAIRTLLADDHALVRAGIRALLRDIADIAIVAEADNGRDAVRLASELTPDLAILDISMKELNGIEAAAQMKAQSPGTRVLILSMHTTEDFVRRALKAGAAGYIVKDSAPLELTMAIEAVMRDETYLSPRVSKSLLSGIVDGRAAPGGSSLDGLTPRQREVLQLVAEGRSTKEIAYALEVSVKTVETHRAALMERLDIRDTASLVVYAVRNGLVSVEGPRDPE
jgi:DNA-binding NarL/FixJ family response regulator